MLYPYSHQLDSQPYEIIISKAFRIKKQNSQEDQDGEDEPIPIRSDKPDGRSTYLTSFILWWIILFVITA